MRAGGPTGKLPHEGWFIPNRKWDNSMGHGTGVIAETYAGNLVDRARDVITGRGWS
ncbi:hypothetical protein QMK19_37280 [Streptomyces sp. H10-C2]|uniref:hypothetical protein n=1 Tax=unclassified Streptomyces TaxID=2593676 RepID=UPI0024B8BCAB|nr:MULTISPECIES: hypothetical protein [unclassified Streptomyces]MDJ0347314.1 hypothetical protein [Streptomyces sp. PH10-H1]MDJ0375111.1 hypothetical protein [Streptomyces sp. H10-C2]